MSIRPLMSAAAYGAEVAGLTAQLLRSTGEWHRVRVGGMTGSCHACTLLDARGEAVSTALYDLNHPARRVRWYSARSGRLLPVDVHPVTRAAVRPRPPAAGDGMAPTPPPPPAGAAAAGLLIGGERFQLTCVRRRAADGVPAAATAAATVVLLASAAGPTRLLLSAQPSTAASSAAAVAVRLLPVVLPPPPPPLRTLEAAGARPQQPALPPKPPAGGWRRLQAIATRQLDPQHQLLYRRVAVYQPLEGRWARGRVTRFDPGELVHTVCLDEGGQPRAFHAMAARSVELLPEIAAEAVGCRVAVELTLPLPPPPPGARGGGAGASGCGGAGGGGWYRTRALATVTAYEPALDLHTLAYDEPVVTPGYVALAASGAAAAGGSAATTTTTTFSSSASPSGLRPHSHHHHHHRYPEEEQAAAVGTDRLLRSVLHGTSTALGVAAALADAGLLPPPPPPPSAASASLGCQIRPPSPLEGGCDSQPTPPLPSLEAEGGRGRLSDDDGGDGAGGEPCGKEGEEDAVTPSGTEAPLSATTSGAAATLLVVAKLQHRSGAELPRPPPPPAAAPTTPAAFHVQPSRAHVEVTYLPARTLTWLADPRALAPSSLLGRRVLLWERHAQSDSQQPQQHEGAVVEVMATRWAGGSMRLATISRVQAQGRPCGHTTPLAPSDLSSLQPPPPSSTSTLLKLAFDDGTTRSDVPLGALVFGWARDAVPYAPSSPPPRRGREGAVQAGAGAALVPPPPPPPTPSRVGLLNMGDSCWLGAALQCLSHCTPLALCLLDAGLPVLLARVEAAAPAVSSSNSVAPTAASAGGRGLGGRMAAGLALTFTSLWGSQEALLATVAGGSRLQAAAARQRGGDAACGAAGYDDGEAGAGQFAAAPPPTLHAPPPLHVAVMPALLKALLTEWRPQQFGGGGGQQDAHEGLLSLLDALHEELLEEGGEQEQRVGATAGDEGAGEVLPVAVQQQVLDAVAPPAPASSLVSPASTSHCAEDPPTATEPPLQPLAVSSSAPTGLQPLTAAGSAPLNGDSQQPSTLPCLVGGGASGAAVDAGKQWGGDDDCSALRVEEARGGCSTAPPAPADTTALITDGAGSNGVTSSSTASAAALAASAAVNAPAVPVAARPPTSPRASSPASSLASEPPLVAPVSSVTCGTLRLLAPASAAAASGGTKVGSLWPLPLWPWQAQATVAVPQPLPPPPPSSSSSLVQRLFMLHTVTHVQCARRHSWLRAGPAGGELLPPLPVRLAPGPRELQGGGGGGGGGGGFVFGRRAAAAPVRAYVELSECLHGYFASETTVGLCEACGAGRPSAVTTRPWLTSLPPVLVVQLKRFDSDCSKLSEQVRFPLTLDMAPYLQPPPPARRPRRPPPLLPPSAAAEEHAAGHCSRYTLFGVLLHSGGVGSGHYTAFARRLGAGPVAAAELAALRRRVTGAPAAARSSRPPPVPCAAAAAPSSAPPATTPPSAEPATWALYDDGAVLPASDADVLAPAAAALAYVLFYARADEEEGGGPGGHLVSTHVWGRDRSASVRLAA